MNNSITSDVINRCRIFSAENQMFTDCNHIVVGFSGGADSCCLLSVLNAIKNEYGFTLTAVHINHGIRGDEAFRDAEFCKQYCEKNGIELLVVEIDVPAVSAESGESCEECARRLRYEIFNTYCTDSHTRIATAHNANDNAETVIFNITRGSSLKGASGIPAVRDNIIRPILTCSRYLTEEYCRENGIEYVTDSTNLTDDYSRNKIRHNILPVLESLNNSAVSHIMRFSQSVSEDCGFLEEVTEKTYYEIFSDFSCDIEKLNRLHISVKKRVISKAVFEFCGKICDYYKLEALCELCLNTGRIQLYGNVFAENVGKVFRVYANSAQKIINAEIVTFADFPVKFGEYRINAELYTNYSKKISNNVLDNLIDCDKIIGSLTIRTRRSGDEFTLGRRNITKTVKKLFNELNVSVEERDLIPLLCDDAGVVWITGVGVARRCRPDKNSTNIYLVGGEKYDK